MYVFGCCGCSQTHKKWQATKRATCVASKADDDDDGSNQASPSLVPAPPTKESKETADQSILKVQRRPASMRLRTTQLLDDDS